MADNRQDKKAVTFCAVGDVRLHRHDPEYPYKEPVFALSAPITKKADIAFCQLESILSDRPNRAYYAGLGHPDNVQDLTYAGFNVVGVATNVNAKCGVEAFVDTLDVLKRNNIQPSGGGMNLAEARSPVVFERNGTKVAILGYCSIIPKGEIPHDAQPQRPGCAPMFVSTFYETTDWQPGMPNPRTITMADKGDVAAMVEDIGKAKTQADVVILSMHWGVHNVPGAIAMYEYEVGHAAIDAGVDLIVGHHAHILKGIEVYKGKVIFHNLGNFAFDKSLQPKKRGWEYHPPAVPEPDYPRAMGIGPDSRKTIMAKAIIANKQIQKVSFLPFMSNKLNQPEPLSRADERSDQVCEYMAWCCRDQNLNTEFVREGDEVRVVTS